MSNASAIRDFRSYGMLEGFNAVLLPAAAIYFGWPPDLAGGTVLALAILGLVIGLVVGTFYWLAVVSQIKRNTRPMHAAMKLASAAQWPMVFIVAAAGIGVGALISSRGWSLSIGVAAVVTLIAALEYVNYYHVQLQHFDNANDWRRLRSGKGFRRSHMARALAGWRRRNVS
jgi:hypothetical protein